MNIQEHTHQDKLERYSFLWSEIRLIIASVALFMGGTPPVFAIIRVPSLSGLISGLLTLAWIISGVASGYLLYRWFTGGKTLFGGKKIYDTIAFLISVVSGVNLGLVGIIQTNIGMSIASSTAIFIIVGLLYLVSAFYLFKRWKACGEKIF